MLMRRSQLLNDNNKLFIILDADKNIDLTGGFTLYHGSSVGSGSASKQSNGAWRLTQSGGSTSMGSNYSFYSTSITNYASKILKYIYINIQYIAYRNVSGYQNFRLSVSSTNNTSNLSQFITYVNTGSWPSGKQSISVNCYLLSKYYPIYGGYSNVSNGTTYCEYYEISYSKEPMYTAYN